MENKYTPFNISLESKNKIKDALPVPEICNCCSGKVEVKTHIDVYGKNYGNYPWVYLCCMCGAYVGMHPNTNIPLGTLADAKTRKARTSCKPVFERIWKSGYMPRTEAYRWLANELGISRAECHFGLFTESMCNLARDACRRYLDQNN